MDIMNSPTTMLVCAVPILVVVVVTLVFMGKAYKEALAIGMKKEVLKKVVVNSALVSVVPTLAIIMSMAMLMPVFGQYVPWFRLSVIGSASYEMMAADIALKSAGIMEGIGIGAIDDSNFINTVWAMSVGCISSLVIAVFALKKLDNSTYSASSNGKTTLLSVTSKYAMIAVMACFVVPLFGDVTNVNSIVGGASSAVVSVILFCVSGKYNIKPLQDFALPISTLVSMGLIVLMNL